MPTHKPGRRPAPAYLGCTPDKVAVRDARGSDSAAIATLLGELGYPTGPEVAGRRLAGIRKAGGSRVLVATVGKCVVGVVGLHVMPLLHRDQRLCRVLALCVSADFTRQGVGTRLMRAAESVARRAGCHRIELTTAAERTGAHAFYRSLGFRETSLRFAKTVSRRRLPCRQRWPQSVGRRWSAAPGVRVSLPWRLGRGEGVSGPDAV